MCKCNQKISKKVKVFALQGKTPLYFHMEVIYANE